VAGASEVLSFGTIRVDRLSNSQFKGVPHIHFWDIVYPFYDVEGGEGSYLPCECVPARAPATPDERDRKADEQGRGNVPARCGGRRNQKEASIKYLVCAITAS
jgi:hypothetical protein